jgi:Major tropism determinant N-terminal domain
MTSRLQQRRDTAANWTSNNPTLAAGEFGLESDTGKFKVGNGSTAWNSLAYGGLQGTNGLQGSAGSQGTSGAVNNLSINAQTGTSYTLVSGDANSLVTASNSGSITITVPPSVFSTGQVITVQQIGAGQVTFAQGSGVTITSTGATSSAPKTRVQYSACSVICTASNTFTIVGDIA